MSIQETFFDLIRETLSSERPNLAQEVAAVLHVSETSAYRRISGHTQLSVDEMARLTSHFNIHPEVLFGQNSRKFVRFQWQFDNSTETSYKTFRNWLEAHLQSLETENSKAIFHAKDFPVFFNFIFPEIAAFKSYFWNKTFFGLQAYRHLKFSADEQLDSNREQGLNIFRSYAAIDSMEIWNDDILNSILQQISYCHEANYMGSEHETKSLLECLIALVDHFQAMAENGCKFLPGEPATGGSMALYHNKVILGDNTLLLDDGDERTVYLSQNIVETLITNDPAFYENAHAIKQNLIRHSMLLSNSSEQERTKYFDRLRQSIHQTRQYLRL